MSYPTRVVHIVVLTIALLALLSLGTVCYCAVANVKPNEAVGAALFGLMSSASGALFGILINPRAGGNPGGESPVKTVIENPPDHPVPTTPQPEAASQK